MKQFWFSNGKVFNSVDLNGIWILSTRLKSSNFCNIAAKNHFTLGLIFVFTVSNNLWRCRLDLDFKRIYFQVKLDFTIRKYYITQGCTCTYLFSGSIVFVWSQYDGGTIVKTYMTTAREPSIYNTCNVP